ncbi:MAG: class II fructose-bisphosphate aldolase, partial [Candidatus Omnitrophica bacterium]|nr:class II fructose-bisphosphate aldolase [Candidatus Omnitrophota bacterium]
VLEASTRLNSPVILMCGPGEFPLLPPAVMGAIARALAKPFSIPAALHLDHGDSLPQVQECLSAGFSSVMLDFSTRPFNENAEALRHVVSMARPHGATVEGEIGSVGKVDQTSIEGGGASTLTDPEEAKAYVEATGVDALAVSIGNAHGLYTRLPQFDFARLKAIRDRVNVPLVLHGGSGTPDDDLNKAIALGMAKVNVASELIHTFRESLQRQWNVGENKWTPGALAVAKQTMAPVLEKWIRRLGAAGMA